MTRWSLLGAGAMAGAMVRGLIASGSARAGDVICIGGNDPSAANLSRETGISAAATFQELLAGADVLIVACKPQNLASLPADLAQLTRGVLVISIVAGKRIGTLARLFPDARNLVRVMPNTPGQIGAGVSGWCPQNALAERDRSIVLALLDALGKNVEVQESDLNAVTAVSGSGPAYVFEFAAALREAGMAAGLPAGTSALLVQETLLGAARLLAQSDTTPETLRDRVTSPGGTTAAALAVFAQAGFRAIVRDAVAAATRRSEELSIDS